MKAMILAAGFGTRLQPYSLQRPKPLFPVLDRPLVLTIINRLQDAGFDRILVNCHYLKEQIVSQLADLDGVYVQEEPIELGTGGGMRMAQDFLGKDPVLVTNGDIFHTIDLAGLYESHRETGAVASLALHDCPRFNKVSLYNDQRILGFSGEHGCRKFAFTGIHVLDPALLSVIPPARFYNIIDCYRHWIEKRSRINGLVVRDHFWTDMGTPEDYLNLHKVLLTEKIFGRESSFYIGEDATIAADCLLEDWVCVGSGATIGTGCRLKRVVVWDGANVPDGTDVADTIIM